MPSLREIVRGGVSRFLPAWGGTVLLVLIFLDGQSLADLTLIQAVLLGGYGLSSLAGYLGSLFGLRRRLRPDADVSGRKSVVAGICSAGAFVITSMLPHGVRTYPSIIVMYLACSALVTGVMYLPWVRVKAPAETADARVTV